MSEPELFQKLKLEVLEAYRRAYPYFKGGWNSFSSADIQNLIQLIETGQRQSVSEKWIYTHLKPADNQKMPRRDMLDIMSRFCGYSGWDEFAFRNRRDVANQTKKRPVEKKFFLWISILICSLGLIIWLTGRESGRIEIKDRITGKPVDSGQVKVYKLSPDGKIPVPIKDGAANIGISNDAQIVIESPFYKTKSIKEPAPAQIELSPNDRALMLKAFMKSDIKDWETRKAQLNEILADDLEVIVMLQEDLGAEYFNKAEFTAKVAVPTESVRQMKIIELRSDQDDRIEFIRIKQE